MAIHRVSRSVVHCFTADAPGTASEDEDLPDGLEEELDDLMAGLSDKVSADQSVFGSSILTAGHHRPLLLRKVPSPVISPLTPFFCRADRHCHNQSVRRYRGRTGHRHWIWRHR